MGLTLSKVCNACRVIHCSNLQRTGINGEWGGRAYGDLVNCFEHVKEAMPFVDTGNAIAAGGSYGGYMAFWIQGMPLGRKLKAIVAHDGIFSKVALVFYSALAIFTYSRHGNDDERR
jgi:dipeptidyl aminopeptidase/acylaminoacyl peptidase